MRKQYYPKEGQHYVAGPKGIRFQNEHKEFIVRKPGEPMPEAASFPRVRGLIIGGKLAIEDIKTPVAPPAPSVKPTVQPPKKKVVSKKKVSSKKKTVKK